MPNTITRRAFGASAALALAAPFIRRAAAAAPIELRCSLDTAPSHPRNVAFRDFLGKLEAASGGQIKTKLFESGSLFPDLQVVKALVQGQVEMACPGTWTITGFVAGCGLFAVAGVLWPADRRWCTRRPTAPAASSSTTRSPTSCMCEVLGGWFDLGFNELVLDAQAAELAGGPEGHEAAQPRRRAEFVAASAIFGGIPNVTAWPDVPLAMSQGTFDGLISTNESVNSAKLFDSGMRHSLQDHQGMGLYVPMVNQAFWQKLGPKLQETHAEAVGGQPAGLPRQHRQGAGRTRARTLDEAGRHLRRCAAGRTGRGARRAC